MDHFQFKPFPAVDQLLPDIPGESQRPEIDAVWGSDGASIIVPRRTDVNDMSPALDLTDSDFLFG